MDLEDNQLAGPYYRNIYKARFEKFGPHPTCEGCLKVNLCLVPNVPGYEFSCNEKLIGSERSGKTSLTPGAGANVHGEHGEIQAPPSARPFKKRRGGWQ